MNDFPLRAKNRRGKGPRTKRQRRRALGLDDRRREAEANAKRIADEERRRDERALWLEALPAKASAHVPAEWQR